MKKLLSLLLACMSFVATSADLVWDDPNPAGAVSAYKVWRQTAPNTWTLVATVTDKRWPVVLPAGQHIVAISAVGSGLDALESDKSLPKQFVLLLVPINVRLEQ